MTNWIAPYNTLLLNIDLTNDFMRDGTLTVTGADDVVPLVNDLRPHFQRVAWTKEEHDAHHAFFASSHPGKKPLDTVETSFGTQLLWPDHCVTGTPGAAFHPDLVVAPEDVVFVKGTDPSIHAYSAILMDDRKTKIHYPDGKTLPETLREMEVDRVVMTGVAFDFCEGLTACDLADEGFTVILVRDASRSIAIPQADGTTTEMIMEQMLENAGVIITTTDQLKHFIYAPAPRLTA